MCTGLDVSPGSNTAQKKTKKKRATSNMFNIECCGSYCQLPTERTNFKKKFVDFKAKSEAKNTC